MKKTLKFLLLFSLIAIFGYIFLFSPLAENINYEIISSMVLDFGIFAPIIFVIVFIISILLLVPAAVVLLAISGMVLFGASGVFYSWLGATTGAMLAFVVSRYLGREFIEHHINKSEKKMLKAIDNALEKEGLFAVLLFRLLPGMPFSLLNYLFGLTKVKPKEYVVATAVGVIPGMALLYVLIQSSQTLDMFSPMIVIPLAVMAVIAVMLWLFRGHIEYHFNHWLNNKKKR